MRTASIVLGLAGLTLALASSVYVIVTCWGRTTYADMPETNRRARIAASLALVGGALQAVALVLSIRI